MMNLIISGDSKTPNVNFNFNENELNISGISSIDDPYPFYKKLQKSIEVFITSNNPTYIIFNVDLTYINAYDLGLFYGLFKVISENNTRLNVNWIYDEDDEDILSIGKKLQRTLNVEFNFFSN